MFKLFRRLAKNKKGSDVVEKIFMTVLAVAIAAAAAVFIWKTIGDASGGKITTTAT